MKKISTIIGKIQIFTITEKNFYNNWKIQIFTITEKNFYNNWKNFVAKIALKKIAVLYDKIKYFNKFLVKY